MKSVTKIPVVNWIFALVCIFLLAGCASYGPSGDTPQFGNYYDQYIPSYAGYQGQEGYYNYPYQPGYYGYPSYPGYYGYPAYGPSIYFGAGRFSGSSGVGIGTTFGF